MIELIISKRDLTKELIQVCKESNIKLTIVDELPEDKNFYFRVNNNNNSEIEPIDPPYDF